MPIDLSGSVSAMTEPWEGRARYRAPPPQPLGDDGPPLRLRNGLGVASLVTAIVAIFPGTLSCVLGPPLGIVAVALGFAARRRVKRGEANNGGMAMAGILLGLVAIVASVVLVFVAYPWLKDAYDYYECTSQSRSKGHPECDWAHP